MGLRASNSTFALPTEGTRLVSLCLAILQVVLWSALLWWNMTHDVAYIFSPLQVWLQSFLFVGLFIVAHDCMHGLVGPSSGRWNQWLGSLCAFLFAGFEFHKLKAKHDEHHDYLATHRDPDYTSGENENFFVWIFSFVTRYFGWKEFLKLHLHVGFFYLLSGSFVKVLVFFALPSWIASLQLFYFGTYRPHRGFQGCQGGELKARSSGYGFWLSLLTCYHFGYHREHHKYPYLAWWRLPNAFNRDNIQVEGDAI